MESRGEVRRGGKSGIEKLVLKLFAAVQVRRVEGLKKDCDNRRRGGDSIKG